MGYGFYQANQLREMFYWRMFLNYVFLYKYKVFCVSFYLLPRCILWNTVRQPTYIGFVSMANCRFQSSSWLPSDSSSLLGVRDLLLPESGGSGCAQDAFRIALIVQMHCGVPSPISWSYISVPCYLRTLSISSCSPRFNFHNTYLSLNKCHCKTLLWKSLV